jgi:hypothetical protein
MATPLECEPRSGGVHTYSCANQAMELWTVRIHSTKRTTKHWLILGRSPSNSERPYNETKAFVGGRKPELVSNYTC